MGVLKVNVGDAVTPDWRKIGCGGGAGVVTFTDDFNRADAPSPGTNWPYVYATTSFLEIVSNQAVRASGIRSAMRDHGAGDHDVTIDTTLTSTNNVTLFLLAGGYSLPFSYVTVQFDGGWLRAVAVDAPAGTSAATAWQGPYTGAYTLRASAVLSGSDVVVNVWTGATLRLTWTTPTPAGLGTFMGLYANAAGSEVVALDNFTASGVGGASDPGRLKLWTGTEWVREKCDGETGHPLKMWDGTTWQTVACLVPA